MKTHFRVGSAFFTLSVTIERYMAISKPLYLNKKRLNFILITASVGISLVYNFPRFFEFKSRKIVSEDIQESNDTAGKRSLSQRYLMVMDSQNFVVKIDFLAGKKTDIKSFV